MRSIGINYFDLGILIEAIRTHTKRPDIDTEQYELYSSSLVQLRGMIGPGDLTALPSKWIEPLIDALESQSLEDYSNVIFYGKLAAHLRKMISWEEK